ncbi:MAG: hypothetical protein M3496_05860 [Pseudomonadota bacterium]|nr:hypothetical protein [Pseudomonadota bacterium]
MMKTPAWKISCCALAVAASTSLTAIAQSTQPAMAPKQGADVMQMVSSWPEASRMATEAMIKKYGPPNEVTATRLIWINNGPWKETIISKEEVDHQFPMAHKDVMEQIIDYKVSPDKFDDLAKYDGSVIVERTKGTMSARCDKEEANFLALNLAHDIARNNKTVAQAREYYARAMKESMSGKMDPYMQKLQFTAQTRTADADQPAKMKTGDMGKSGSPSRTKDMGTTSGK